MLCQSSLGKCYSLKRLLREEKLFRGSSDEMDFTESSMKISTTPFSINDILTSSNNQQSLSKKLKQFCRFRRSSLDCFIVSKDEQSVNARENSDKSYLQLFNNNNNPLDMRCRHSDMNVSGN